MKHNLRYRKDKLNLLGRRKVRKLFKGRWENENNGCCLWTASDNIGVASFIQTFKSVYSKAQSTHEFNFSFIFFWILFICPMTITCIRRQAFMDNKALLNMWPISFEWNAVKEEKKLSNSTCEWSLVVAYNGVRVFVHIFWWT